MNCRNSHHLLVPYLEDTVTVAEWQAMDAHLQGCAAFRSELDALAATRSRVSDWIQSQAVHVNPPADAWPRLHARIAALPAGRRLPVRSLRYALLVFSIACLVLPVLGVIAGDRTLRVALDDLLHGAAERIDSSGLIPGARSHLVVFNEDLPRIATLDTVSGSVVSQVDSVIDSRKVVAADGWAYFLSGKFANGRFDLAVSGIDLNGEAAPSAIGRSSIPADRHSDIEASLADVRLLRSADARHLVPSSPPVMG